MPKQLTAEDFGSVRLSHGPHSYPEKGVCAMELVALLQGKQHTDQSPCVCSVLTEFVIQVNDYNRGRQDLRNGLMAYLPQLTGTRSGNHWRKRKEALLRAAAQRFAAKELRNNGFTSEAKQLETFTGTKKDLGELCRNFYSVYNGEAEKRLYSLSSADEALYYDDYKEIVNAAGHANAWDGLFTLLQEAIDMGPHGPKTLTPEMKARLKAYQEDLEEAA